MCTISGARIGCGEISVALTMRMSEEAVSQCGPLVLGRERHIVEGECGETGGMQGSIR